MNPKGRVFSPLGFFFQLFYTNFNGKYKNSTELIDISILSGSSVKEIEGFFCVVVPSSIKVPVSSVLVRKVGDEVSESVDNEPRPTSCYTMTPPSVNLCLE